MHLFIIAGFFVILFPFETVSAVTLVLSLTQQWHSLDFSEYCCMAQRPNMYFAAYKSYGIYLELALALIVLHFSEAHPSQEEIISCYQRKVLNTYCGDNVDVFSVFHMRNACHCYYYRLGGKASSHMMLHNGANRRLMCMESGVTV